MKQKAIIYADPNDSKLELPGGRMSYFYLDGEAERKTGYDCCNGNIEALRMCMSSHMFLATLVYPDQSEDLCIANSWYEGNMAGLIAVITDHDAIKNILNGATSTPSMYEHEKIFLKENYPEVVDLIKKTTNENYKKEPIKSGVPRRILTEQEVKEKFKHYLTVGDLKKSIEGYNIPDEAKVVVQRIEDVYYNKHGWGSMLKEGEHYHNTIQMNENMREEIARRERGEESEYPEIENPNEYICEDEEILKELKDQYHPAWCVAGYKDKDFLFIDLHY